MTDSLKTISPVDGSIYVERALAGEGEIDGALDAAVAAQIDWRQISVADRATILSSAVDAFVAAKDDIATEITWQMGRPLTQSPGEVAGFEERARHMIAIADDALADRPVGDKPGFTRFIRRVPLGVVFVVAPWNYPYLTAVNAVIPALMAGNAVILKHSAQTPLCAERLGEAFAAAGLPRGVFQHLHLSHGAVDSVVRDPEFRRAATVGGIPQRVESILEGLFSGTLAVSSLNSIARQARLQFDKAKDQYENVFLPPARQRLEDAGIKKQFLRAPNIFGTVPGEKGIDIPAPLVPEGSFDPSFVEKMFQGFGVPERGASSQSALDQLLDQ
ncbi:MAG: aldehyde dehydrogenase family protein, partial [Proteobacteria bacterium]|nr:aldehyde dehydrogenase family protein [Pseudomonadota bacterium]